jgi:hypothetical protein
MIWRRRCLVLVPVLSFLAAALIMSCGGGSSSSSFPVENSRSIVGLNVCSGAPPSATPTPTPTNGHTPTPMPTPICTPIVSSGMVGTTIGNNLIQFQAQGIFGLPNNSKNLKYRDVTNSTTTLWNPVAPSMTFPGVIYYQHDGQFVGVTTGCTYFTVSDGGFAQSVIVGVNADPASCPTPPGPAVASQPAASITPSP